VSSKAERVLQLKEQLAQEKTRRSQLETSLERQREQHLREEKVRTEALEAALKQTRAEQRQLEQTFGETFTPKRAAKTPGRMRILRAEALGLHATEFPTKERPVFPWAHSGSDVSIGVVCPIETTGIHREGMHRGRSSSGERVAGINLSRDVHVDQTIAGNIPSHWPQGIQGNQVPLGRPPPSTWAFFGGGSEVQENSVRRAGGSSYAGKASADARSGGREKLYSAGGTAAETRRRPRTAR